MHAPMRMGSCSWPSMSATYATYRNAWKFLAKYESVLYRNVGSLMCPIMFADACTCPSDEIPTNTIEYLGHAEVPSPENMLGGRG
jgi:hypothetical protein